MKNIFQTPIWLAGMYLLTIPMTILMVGCTPPSDKTAPYNKEQKSFKSDKVEQESKAPNVEGYIEGDNQLNVVMSLELPQQIVLPYREVNNKISNINTQINFNGTAMVVQYFDGLIYYIEYKMGKNWTPKLMPYGKVIKGSVKDRYNRAYEIEVHFNEEEEIFKIQIGSVTLYRSRPNNIGEVQRLSSDPISDYTYLTVREGMNMKYIAQEVGITLQELLDLNPSIKARRNHQILVGEKVKIPKR